MEMPTDELYEPYSVECIGPLALDNNLELSMPVPLDISYHEGASVALHFNAADDTQEIYINKLNLTTHNFNTIHFVAKKYKITIDQLNITCPGIRIVADGLNIKQCNIFTSRPEIDIKNFRADCLIIASKPNEDEEWVRHNIRAITMIPGCGEFALNKKSIDELLEAFPNLEYISLVVSWFASSLDLKTCQITPGIDTNLLKHPKHPKIDSWKVGKYTANGVNGLKPMDIYQVDSSEHDGKDSIYGGTINDADVIEYIEHAKQKGLKIIFYPLIMVNQVDKPWRGDLGKEDKERLESGAIEAADIYKFYKEQYEPFILYYAELVKSVAHVFIIGSELIGLTSLKTCDNRFPFVEKLIELAGKVREILGEGVKITYAADWSEYHSCHGGLRPLDELWANHNIDFVGIDNYFPLTNSTTSNFTLEELRRGCSSGRYFCFDYNAEGKAITLQSEDQSKNFYYWWRSEHYSYDKVTNIRTKTLWDPKSGKQIWFTESGFSSIDKSPNSPNIFYDPKSIAGGIPAFSNGKVDYAVQRLALRAMLEHFQGQSYIGNIVCWTWDARGLGWQNNPDYADGYLWKFGHWIDGKIGAPRNTIILKSDNVEVGNLNVTAAKIEFDQVKLVVRDKITLLGNSLIISCSDISTDQLLAGFRDGRIEFDSVNLNIKGGISLLGKDLTILNSDIRADQLLASFKDGRIEFDSINLTVKGDTSFLGKCLTALKTNISAGQLLIIIKGGKAEFNYTKLNIKDEAYLLGNTLALFDSHINAGRFLGAFKDNITVIPHIWTQQSSYHIHKYTVNETISYTTTPKIKAIEAAIIVGGKLSLENASFKINKLFIKAGDIEFKTVVTKDEKTTQYIGKRDAWGRRKSWTEFNSIESAYQVEINSQKLEIDVANHFKAMGGRIITSKMYTKASDYHFTGLHLNNNNNINRKDKGGIFCHAKKSTHINRHLNVQGVEVIVAGNAYMIAEGKIWLQASHINADRLKLKADKVILEALIGHHFYYREEQKHNLRIALTCSGGELSVGIESNFIQKKFKVFSQHAEASALIGRNSLTIEANELIQIGGIIKALKAKIIANKWLAIPLELLQVVEAHSISVSAGVKVGIRENVTNALKGIKNAVLKAGEGGKFAAINTVSNFYASAEAMIALARGEIVSPIFLISASSRVSHYKKNNTIYITSKAEFSELEAHINGDIEGALEVKVSGKNIIKAKYIKLTKAENKVHVRSSSTGVSVSNLGCSVSHYQEKDGHGFGGVITERPFGYDVRVLYKCHNEYLDLLVQIKIKEAEETEEALDLRPKVILSKISQNLQKTTHTLFSKAYSVFNTLNHIGFEKVKILAKVPNKSIVLSPCKHLIEADEEAMLPSNNWQLVSVRKSSSSDGPDIKIFHSKNSKYIENSIVVLDNRIKIPLAKNISSQRTFKTTYQDVFQLTDFKLSTSQQYRLTTQPAYTLTIKHPSVSIYGLTANALIRLTDGYNSLKNEYKFIANLDDTLRSIYSTKNDLRDSIVSVFKGKTPSGDHLEQFDTNDRLSRKIASFLVEKVFLVIDDELTDRQVDALTNAAEIVCETVQANTLTQALKFLKEFGDTSQMVSQFDKSSKSSDSVLHPDVRIKDTAEFPNGALVNIKKVIESDSLHLKNQNIRVDLQNVNVHH